MDLTEIGLPSSPREPSRTDSTPLAGVDLHAQHSSNPTGGDLFDTLQIGTRLAFLLTDIAGRRPELDLIAAQMQRVFRTTVTELFLAANVNLTEATETLIIAVNSALITAANGVRFAPTMVGCYDAQLGILAYINAGGQTALFRDSEGTRALPNVSVPLGLFTHMTYDASIQAFEPGAMLLAVTKGVTESMGNKHPPGAEGVMAVLQHSVYASATEVCSAVLDAAHPAETHHRDWLPFRGKPAIDDMTAFAMVRTA